LCGGVEWSKKKLAGGEPKKPKKEWVSHLVPTQLNFRTGKKLKIKIQKGPLPTGWERCKGLGKNNSKKGPGFGKKNLVTPLTRGVGAGGSQWGKKKTRTKPQKCPQKKKKPGTNTKNKTSQRKQGESPTPRRGQGKKIVQTKKICYMKNKNLG